MGRSGWDWVAKVWGFGVGFRVYLGFRGLGFRIFVFRGCRWFSLRVWAFGLFSGLEFRAAFGVGLETGGLPARCPTLRRETRNFIGFRVLGFRV